MSTDKTSQNFLDQLDDLIRKGSAIEARQLFKHINPSKIPRQRLAKFAQIARRLQCFHWGLRLLSPVIKNSRMNLIQTTNAENLEYGILLSKVGISKEANNIFNQISGEEHPEVYLYQAMTYFTQWDYYSALPLLEKYIAHPQVNDYRQSVGQVNLAAALIFEDQLEPALNILEQLEKDCRQRKDNLLLGNVFELKTQIFFKQRDWKRAKKIVSCGLELVSESHAISHLYLQKWSALIDSYQKNRLIKEIFQVRQIAKNLCQWEVCRDLDFHSACINKDTQILNFVFFGTPHERYRQSMLNYTPIQWCPPEEWLVSFNNFSSSSHFDAFLIESQNNLQDLMIGGNLHKLLMILLRDFYVPLNSISAFSFLFPDNYFDPLSSLNRVHQLIDRLKKWLDQTKAGFSIENQANGYQLKSHSENSFKVYKHPPTLEEFEIRLWFVRKKMNKTIFSVADVQKTIKQSYGTAYSLVTWAVENNHLVKTGSGRNTRYQFSDNINLLNVA